MFDGFSRITHSYIQLYIQEWYDNPSLNWYPSVESNILEGEKFLTDEPQKLMQSGKIFGVPLIIGVTKDEYSYKVAGILNADWLYLKGN